MYLPVLVLDSVFLLNLSHIILTYRNRNPYSTICISLQHDSFCSYPLLTTTPKNNGMDITKLLSKTVDSELQNGSQQIVPKQS